MSRYKPRTSTHWCSVTKEIQRRTGADWNTAKEIFHRIRSARETPLSVAAARQVPERSLRSYKGAITRALRAAAEQQRVEQRLRKHPEQAAPPPPLLREGLPRLKPAPLPRAVEKRLYLRPAPPPPLRPAPAEPFDGKPRNQFQRLLKDAGLPKVPGASGKRLAALYRHPEAQREFVRVLKEAYREVKLKGAMSENTKIALAALLEKYNIKDAYGSWFQIVKALYKLQQTK